MGKTLFFIGMKRVRLGKRKYESLLAIIEEQSQEIKRLRARTQKTCVCESQWYTTLPKLREPCMHIRRGGQYRLMFLPMDVPGDGVLAFTNIRMEVQPGSKRKDQTVNVYIPGWNKHVHVPVHILRDEYIKVDDLDVPKVRCDFHSNFPELMWKLDTGIATWAYACEPNRRKCRKKNKRRELVCVMHKPPTIRVGSEYWIWGILKCTVDRIEQDEIHVHFHKPSQFEFPELNTTATVHYSVLRKESCVFSPIFEPPEDHFSYCATTRKHLLSGERVF